jgi:hypothetical protein
MKKIKSLAVIMNTMKKLLLMAGGVLFVAAASFTFAQEVNVSSKSSVSTQSDGGRSSTSMDADASVSTGTSSDGTKGTQASDCDVAPASSSKELDKSSTKLQESTVSGKATIDPLDDDSDGDRLEVNTGRIDKATPLLFKANGSVDAGVTVEYAQDTDANGGLDRRPVADLDGDGALDVVVARLHVDGLTVRGWDPERKEAIRARLAQNSEVTSANDFGLSVAQAAIDHEKIVDIESTETETSVAYKTKIKLFGFISMNVTARARAQTDEKVKVKFPWYAFLAAKGDQSVYTSLAVDLRTKHNIAMNAVRNMK